jgi:hypothetical protein
VQPTEETIGAGLADVLAAIPGVARIAPQTIVRVLVDGTESNLVGFDPERDLSIRLGSRSKSFGRSRPRIGSPVGELWDPLAVRCTCVGHDQPTSDLDEDTEAEIFGLLEEL